MGCPRSIKQVRTLKGKDDYGLYQIYGTHPKSGAKNTLLYIGKVGAGTQAETFGNQLHENYHFIKEYCTTGGRIGEISIRIGRIHCEEYAGERY